LVYDHTRIVYPAAKNGLLTGVLLAVARISGETAPLLLFTRPQQTSSGNSRLDRPMANLPVVIFQFAMSPYKDWQQLAWVGALLITMFILFSKHRGALDLLAARSACETLGNRRQNHGEVRFRPSNILTRFNVELERFAQRRAADGRSR